MFRTWHSLSREQAQAHPFYGVGGWLYVLVAYLSAGLALNVALPMLHPQGFRASFPSDGGLVLWVVYVVVAGAGLAALVQRMRAKHPRFRVFATAILVAGGVAALAAYPELGAPELGENLVRWALYALIWVAYLHRSVRVRLTFEHATNAGDPYLDTLQEELSSGR